MNVSLDAPIASSSGPAASIPVTVIATESIADEVTVFTLVAVSGELLPEWHAGAHIDVLLPNEMARQYSLCGDPSDLSSYRIGVLRSANGRGGSLHLHDRVTVGDTLMLRGPRNQFALTPASNYLFIAGGIGITPIMPMIRSAEKTGASWSLIYLGRTLSAMPFRDELSDYGKNVTLWPKDSHGRFDLQTLFNQQQPQGSVVFSCGPETLLADVLAFSTDNIQWPTGTVNVERFTPLDVDNTTNIAFEVELAVTGATLTVPSDKSIMEVLESVGINVLSSCGEGTCGSCETEILSGEADHRDSVLTTAEQEENNCLMVCVSRSACPLLVLNI